MCTSSFVTTVLEPPCCCVDAQANLMTGCCSLNALLSHLSPSPDHTPHHLLSRWLQFSVSGVVTQELIAQQPTPLLPQTGQQLPVDGEGDVGKASRRVADSDSSLADLQHMLLCYRRAVVSSERRVEPSY